jgi:hypothetical protein
MSPVWSVMVNYLHLECNFLARHVNQLQLPCYLKMSSQRAAFAPTPTRMPVSHPVPTPAAPGPATALPGPRTAGSAHCRVRALPGPRTAGYPCLPALAPAGP